MERYAMATNWRGGARQLAKRFRLIAGAVVLLALSAVLWLCNLLFGDYAVTQFKEATASHHWEIGAKVAYWLTTYPTRSAVILTCVFLALSEVHNRVKGHPLWKAIFDDSVPSKQEKAVADESTRKMASAPATTPSTEGGVAYSPIWLAVKSIANAISDTNTGEAFRRSRDEIRQAALDGKITIWGRKQTGSLQAPRWIFDTCLTEVPRAYWKAHKLTGIASAEPLNPDYPFTIQVEPDGSPWWATSYADLHVNRAEIAALSAVALAKDFEFVTRQFLGKNPLEVVINREGQVGTAHFSEVPSTQDPRIYVEIKDERQGMFPRTPFVITNRGGSVGHKIRVGPMQWPEGRVTFTEIDSLAPDCTIELDPRVEGTEVFHQKDVSYVLRGRQRMSADFHGAEAFPFAVEYQDFSGQRKFRADMNVMYASIRDALKRGRMERGKTVTASEPTIWVSHENFKRLS